MLRSGLAIERLLLAFILILFLAKPSISQINSQPTGTLNWSSPASWVGGVVPTAGQSVVIAAGCTMRVDVNTAVVLNVTVNGFLDVLNTATSTLTYNGNMVVAGTLRNNGGIVQSSSTNKTFQLSGNGTYIHNPRNLTNIDESIFEKSNEIFSVTSNLIIQKWYDLNTPLGGPTRVQQPIEFGNVTMNIPDPGPWEQDNQFMTSMDTPRIKGTLTVSSGIVRMDDGAAMSDFMEFSDIIINGTGSIIFASGPSRPFVLLTDNFTDISTSINPTVIMDNVFNITFWTVNGSVTLGHNFFGIVGSGVNPGGNLTVTISGNLSITGGSVQFVSRASASLTLNVSGNTTISGTPTKVRFVDGNLGNLTFTTNNFIISGGNDNVLFGGNGLIPSATGIPVFNINNDFIVNGGNSTTYLVDASNITAGYNTQLIRLTVGHDMLINSANSNLIVAKSRGPQTIRVNNNFTLSAGRFTGQIDTANAAIDSMIVTANFLINSPAVSDYFRLNYGDGNTVFRCNGNFSLYNTSTTAGMGFVGIYEGTGNMTFWVGNFFNIGNGTPAGPGRFAGIYNSKPWIETGDLNFTVQTNFNMGHPQSVFRGVENRFKENIGTVNFYAGNLNYSGGNFSGYYSVHTDPVVPAKTANFTIVGLLQITFTTAATDTFTFIGLNTLGADFSKLKLNVNVSGNFNITGFNGSFVSSIAKGREFFNVGGSFNISGGKNSFNSYPNSGINNQHPVEFFVGTDMAVNGGSTYLSANNDSLIANINGNLSVTLGELIVQGGESSPGILNVAGGYTQTGGNFYIHNNDNGISNKAVEVVINSDNNATGNFSHTGGTITFSTNPTSPGAKILNIVSPAITYGGNGIMTMANPGTSPYSGIIRYGKTGAATFTRSSNNHSIQQVTQNVMPGCTLTVISGNMQIASLVASVYDRLNVNADAVLDLQTNQIFSNNLQPFSGISVTGRIRLARPQGFYDGTANAALNANGGMNYRLLTNSTIEYNGIDNQILTGINVGLATVSWHKYYNLDINFNGTPNTEYVYPTNIPTPKSVFVRNRLSLTNGELSLDNDRNPVGGGRSIIIERDSVNAIVRTNGYIRSEVYDSSASVLWVVNTMTGARTIPFGFNSTSYIPFTFSLNSGDADTLILSTYRTPLSNNLPFPPPVTHLRDLNGVDNSANTVDRFWYIASTGTSADAHLTFTATPSEIGAIVNPRAQLWLPTGPNAWQYPLQGTQSTISNGTYVANAYYYPGNWWTLAGLSTPLPVTLLDFNATCYDEQTNLKWSTASELNNAFFTVLKSENGTEYQTIGTLTGAGTTSNVSNYQFSDPDINTRTVYFKLMQTDYDGKETVYGPIVSDPCSKSPDMDVTVIHSNPEELSVIIRNPEPGNHLITLYGADGRIIHSKKADLVSGINLVTLPVHGIATGVYFVNVRSTTVSTTSKVPVGYGR